jgi:ribosome-associated translation inhibitor RaiA
MKVQPTVTFRGIPNSQALEADIHARLARLEKFCPDIISAQVVVELGERHHRDGKRWRVRLDVSVPGEHIIVKNESTLRPEVRAREVQATRKQDESDAGQKYAKVAVRESFEVAKRQLQDHVRRRRQGKAEAARRRPARQARARA